MLSSDTHTFQYRTGCSRVAVLVEPTVSSQFTQVVQNVMHCLGPEWNFHLFSSEVDKARRLLPHCTFFCTTLDQASLTEQDVNTLMRKASFWRAIQGETVLLFQTNTRMLRSVAEATVQQWEKCVHFLGAAFWNCVSFPSVSLQSQLANSPTRHFSINGGFSVRNKHTMLRCLQTVSMDMIVQHRRQRHMSTLMFEQSNVREDFFFQNACDVLRLRLPTLEECQEFCMPCQNLNLHRNTNYGSLALAEFEPMGEVRLSGKQLSPSSSFLLLLLLLLLFSFFSSFFLLLFLLLLLLYASW